MHRSLAISLTFLTACTGAHTLPDAPTDPDRLDASLDAATDASLGAEPDATLVEQDVPCPPGFAMCEGSCVLASENPMYCGADPACERYTRCLGNETCIEGACALECEPGLANCEGFCVDPRTDPSQCGATLTDCSGGVRCRSGEVCVLGSCAEDCGPGFVRCFGRCIDPRSDRQYCGVGPDCTGGDGTCLSGQVCAAGECAATCPPGLIECSSRCVDPRIDHAFCGASSDCSGGAPCTSSEVCVDGSCMASCPLPQQACGGHCVDPSSDERFCGAGPDCAGGELCSTGSECRSGRCVPVCGGVVCELRQQCTSGTCGCVAPERDCGGACVDLRHDASNCGACGRACAATERCVASACMASAGLTGGFGDAWASFPFEETHCIQEFVSRSETDLYGGHGGRFSAWEMIPMRSRAATPPAYAIQEGCSFASYGGGIFQVVSTDVMLYQPPTGEWRTAPLGTDLGPLGMTITGVDSLWTANDAFLYEASPATSVLATYALPTRLGGRARLTWEALGQRVFFAGRGDLALRSYHPSSRTFRLEALAPGPIGAAFCSDRAGHVYVGSEADPRRIWQYTPASGLWLELPLLPASVTGTTNCGVAETGALYVASAPGAELHRLTLERR